MRRRTQLLFGFMKRFPLMSFVLFLALLFGVIVVGTQMRTAEDSIADVGTSAKHVTLYTPSGATTTVSGVVDNRNVVTVRATASGIVSHVYVTEGQRIRRGTQIATLADNYTGSNVATTASAIAQRSAETQAVVSAKDISIIEDQRDDVSGDGMAAEIARKQLTIQKRTAELAKDVAVLEKQRAHIAAAAYYPRAPIAGTVERVFVTTGERVVVGDALAIVYGSGAVTTVTVTVDAQTARRMSVTVPAQIDRGDAEHTIEVLPAYVSQAPTTGQMYSVVFVMDEMETVEHGSFVSVTLPLEAPHNGVYVPLDAVTLTNEGAIVFVAENGVAHARTVTLDAVFGDMVVAQGLDHDVQIIRERNVFDGDPISTN